MNAKQEFIEHIKDREVLCVIISDDYTDNNYPYNKAQRFFVLRKGYSSEEYNCFLNLLDFEYDNGYGCQELYGYIWYADGTWSSRREYDGSEWWEYYKKQ